MAKADKPQQDPKDGAGSGDAPLSPAAPNTNGAPNPLGLADRAQTEAAAQRAAEAEQAAIAAAMARSPQSGTALLHAPKDMTAVAIDGTQYEVEADGTILVEERHVAALLGIGCTC